MRSIKLYSVSLPLAVAPILAFSFDQIGPYLKGMEFRQVLASLVAQLISGTANAFIISGVTQFFSGLGI
ncbi:MAG: hypothetical protein FWC56_02500 [Phycisphaerae bacterium]|nr:hypothetical protein [Phycisphaerae bacterium]